MSGTAQIRCQGNRAVLVGGKHDVSLARLSCSEFLWHHCAQQREIHRIPSQSPALASWRRKCPKTRRAWQGQKVVIKLVSNCDRLETFELSPQTFREEMKT